MPNRDLVVIGASAGGLEALMRLVAELPGDLPATLLIVMHIAPEARSNLAAILDRSGPLPAHPAQDGMLIEPSHIVCCPPDHHLIVADGRVRMSRGPHENLHRPSVDVLFRSAAVAHDGRTCGIVLSGALDDGAAGMRAIQRTGGLTIVQDPADALVPGMPASALEAIEPDHVLAADAIGKQLPRLLGAPRRATDADTEAVRRALRLEIAAPGWDRNRTSTTRRAPHRHSAVRTAAASSGS